MNKISDIEIIDFDSKYVDQHVEIREVALENVRFRSKELMMSKDEIKQKYSSPIHQSSNIIRYAIKDDKLLGFISCSMENSLMMQISVDDISSSATLGYPMVREGEQRVMELLIENIRDQIADYDIDEVNCHIATEYQFSNEMSSKYFDFVKPLIQKGKVDLTASYNLPVNDSIIQVGESYHDQIKEGLITTLQGIPEEFVDEKLMQIFDADYPSLAIIEEESDTIKAWLSVLPSEKEKNTVDIQLPYIPVDLNYTKHAIKLISGLINRLRERSDVSFLSIPPSFRSDVIEQLKDAGIEFKVMMGHYKMRID